MCACQPGFTCSRCAGAWLADDYPELLDWRETDEAGRGAGGAREASEGDE